MVEHPQGLLGRRSLVALRDVIVGISEVEGPEDGGQVLAVDEAVDGSAGGREVGDQVKGLPARLHFEISGDAEDAVPHCFKIEAAAIGAPGKKVIRVFGDARGVEFGGLAKSAGEHDGADELLHRPVVGHEGGGEVIEEFGVFGRSGADAEVARGLHQRNTDELRPDAIDHHASRQRIGFAGDSIGEFQTPAAFFEFLRRAVGKDREELACNVLAGSAGAASKEDHALGWLGFILKRHGVGRALGARGLEGHDFSLKFGARVAVGDVVAGDERVGGNGSRAVRGLDECAPRLPFGEGVLLGLVGFGEGSGEAGGEFAELLRGLLLNLGAQ